LDKKNLKNFYKLRYSNHIKNMYAAKHPSSIAANSPRSLPITIEPENGKKKKKKLQKTNAFPHKNSLSLGKRIFYL
jgi:hypothetical protein